MPQTQPFHNKSKKRKRRNAETPIDSPSRSKAERLNQLSNAESSKLKRPKPNASIQHQMSTTRLDVLNPKIMKNLTDLGTAVSDCTDKKDLTDSEMSDKLRGLVRLAAELLPVVSLKTIFEHVPNLPRTLANAAKLSSLVSSSDVILCFLYLVIDKFPKDVTNTNDPDEETNVAKSEEALKKRAVEWALPVLTQVLASSPSSSSHNHIFIEPWYKVHEEVLSKQAKNFSIAVSRLKEMPLEQFQSVIDGLLHTFTRLIEDGPKEIPRLLSSIVTNVTSLPHSIKALDECDYAHGLPAKLFYSGSIQQRSKIFHRLSIAAKADLLYLSNQIYLDHVKELKSTITWKASIDLVFEETKTLAKAAEKHASIHWRLMDQVYKTVEADEQPFSLFMWKDRVWMRGVLQTVEKLLGQDITWRLHPNVRRHISQVMILDQALCKGGNIKAGVMGMHILYSLMELKKRKGINRLWETSLIVVEGLVERLIWACGRSQRRGEVIDTISKEQLLHMCCSVIVGMQTLRVKGGLTVDGEIVVMKQRDGMANVLSMAWKGMARTEYKGRKEFCAGSLFGIAVVSALGVVDGKQWLLDFVGKDADYMLHHEMNWACKMSNEMDKCCFSTSMGK